MDEEIRRIGTEEGLFFEVTLHGDSSQADVTWRGIRLFVGGRVVWSGDDEAFLEWSLVDLLEFLAQNWPSLLLEESWPLPLRPVWPVQLRDRAEEVWDELSDDEVDEQEQLLEQFLDRHDLARAMKGVFLPSVFLLRQGRSFLLSSAQPSVNVVRPFDEIRETLELLGETLASYVSKSRDPRAVRAWDIWQSRYETLHEQFLPLRSGLSMPALKKIDEEFDSSEGFWEVDELRPEIDTPLFAAARMSVGLLSSEQQIRVLRSIRTVPAQSYDAVERLAACLSPQALDRERPYILGHRAAAEVRIVLGVQETETVEPEQILEDLDVHVERIDLDSAPLDAIAVWGERHGPAILLNEKPGSRATHRHGRRSTLAHELCHLLLDRGGALPVGEVLGGRVPELPEKRARAFAAEFLLPREAAATVWRRSGSIEETFAELSRTYDVSDELIAWQIRNGPASISLTDDDRAFLNARIRQT